MAILHSLVARGSVVLAEFSASQSNASAIARQILEKIPGNNDSHVSYSQDRYIFHVKRTDGLTVLCMADDTAGRRIPFAYLEDIHGRFVKTYGRSVHTALAYAMNDEFSRVLSQQMEYYSNDPNADRINRMRGEMSQVRNVMIENIDKVLERGDRLELLVDKTANMQGNTFRFRKQARRFKNTIWWRNVKLMRSMVPCILSLMYSPSGIMLSYWENSRINHKAEGEEGSEGKRNKQQGNVFLYQMKFATITPHCINVIPLFKYQAGSQALWTSVNGLMQYGTRILLFHKRA